MAEQSPDYALIREQLRQAYDNGETECLKKVERFLKLNNAADLAIRIAHYVRAGQ